MEKIIQISVHKSKKDEFETLYILTNEGRVFAGYEKNSDPCKDFHWLEITLPNFEELGDGNE